MAELKRELEEGLGLWRAQLLAAQGRILICDVDKDVDDNDEDDHHDVANYDSDDDDDEDG